jgi:hypothetical protein
MKLIVLAIAMIICMAVIYWSCRTEAYRDGSTLIFGKPTRSIKPKIFWTYWEDSDIPDIIRKCIATWEKHHPDYDIIILNKETLHLYCDDDIYNLKHADTPPRISDFVRLAVLTKYGGTWIDCSSILTEPLQDHPYECVGYYIDGFTTKHMYPVIESWFISCVKNCQFVKKWKDAFYSINNYDTIDDYLSATRKTTDFQNINSPAYLTIHVAAQYVLQNDNGNFSLYLMKAEDGPLKYLAKNEWKSDKAIDGLIKGEHITPIVKFRSQERNVLEKLKNEIKVNG